MRFLGDTTFRVWSLSVAALCSVFFAWELGAFRTIVWSLSRPPPTSWDILYTVLIIVLLSLAAGLVGYRRKKGTCPVGARNASSIAGALGVITLLCPVCLLLPATLFGIGFSLALLAPYLPLLRLITIMLLSVSMVMLWPKTGDS
ncbi:hypothetical protein FJZ28_03820 [Candidatus Peregrinibacteria bacterium]|nr:hypothetical protein [Candidatus Peregrinibacteria bacterium]